MKRILRGCSPHHHPYRWLVVNALVLLWSAVLLARIFSATGSNNDDEKTRIELGYLVYNFGACAIWLVEVFFNVLDHKEFLHSEGATGEESLLRAPPAPERKKRTKKEVMGLWIEAALAAYFFLDSTTVAVHLSRGQIHKQSEGMTIDVCVNMAAYCFMVYRQFADWRAEGNNEEIAEQSSEVADGHSEGLV
eukprot:CAMPEP_0181033272 /NCGR_PEP_ID=MMETSP1070-20121207/7169_1 /TAXON_ID=265543 /ORGANISM="Minutocellus polymorphus, Strain NH13" /LENGTH=191 /DNA_ID=CAMNT_0023110689 /DNA_START=297 /DNA_END=872 /DNA_ORIENTATION=-